MVDSFSKFGPELVRIRAWRRRDSDSVHNRASVVSPNRAPTRRRPEAVEPSAELGNVLPDPREGSEFPVDKPYFDFRTVKASGGVGAGSGVRSTNED